MWSDPKGAFRAAIAADTIYELFGASGFDQSDLDEENLEAELSFYIRPGRHGVTTRDWQVFLDFADQQLLGDPS